MNSSKKRVAKARMGEAPAARNPLKKANLEDQEVRHHITDRHHQMTKLNPSTLSLEWNFIP